jgi:peptidoglycan/LPS O-acetylase OafA/YrhL/predicted DNA-binding transcriptional regulator
VAVVLVVLFHAGFPLLGGGYVGVDVFFVISGYLITSLILKELAGGGFSFAGFWMRRARRILPALAVVVLFTLIAGWILFSPADYKDLGRTVLTQAFFSSNIYFWLTSGYFAGPSEAKPLLHTWSLSVEEQFYLVIPLTLFVLTRHARRFSRQAILILLIASFLSSVWSSYAYPDAAFYLPHSRAWELLLGSLLATSIPKRPAQSRPAWRVELAGAAGVAAILGAAVFYDRSTPFPGVAALAPCLGTAAVIWSGTHRPTRIKSILTHRIPVWIGLISYSLYLWHWPLLAFWRYLSPYALSGAAATGVVLASVPVAWFSYRYVEMPVRRGAAFRRRALAMPAAAAVLVAMLLAGSYVNATNGVDTRIMLNGGIFDVDLRPPGRRRQLCQPLTSVAMPSKLLCRLGQVSNSHSKVLLLGDSFAEMYLAPMEILSRKYQQEVWYVRQQNVPVHPYLLEAAVKYPVSQIVLSYSWKRAGRNGIAELYRQSSGIRGWMQHIFGGYNPVRLMGDTKSDFRENLEQLVREFSTQNIGITVIDAPPHYSVPVPLKLRMLMRQGGDPEKYGSLLSNFREEQSYIYDVFRDIRSSGVQIVSVTDVLCDASGFCHTYLNGHSLYADEIHLSAYGAELTIPLLETIFTRAAATDFARVSSSRR